MPSAPSAPVPNAPASAAKPSFDLPSDTYDRPAGKAFNPKKGWFCEGPPEGVFAEKAGHVEDEMKGQMRSYMDVIHTQLMDSWVHQLPRDAKRNAWAAARETKVRFMIWRDGTHSAPEITVASGRADYDRAALEAIRLHDTFPPMPDGYEGPTRMCMTFMTNQTGPDHSQDWMKKLPKQ